MINYCFTKLEKCKTVKSIEFLKKLSILKKKTGKELFRSLRVILNFHEMSALTIRPMFFI